MGTPEPRHSEPGAATLLRTIVGQQVSVAAARLLEAHEIVIAKVRDAVRRTAANDDGGTNDLLMGDVLRRHELQVWFLAEHLVDTPVVRV